MRGIAASTGFMVISPCRSSTTELLGRIKSYQWNSPNQKTETKYYSGHAVPSESGETMTNMNLRPGAYVTVGRGVMALIDEDTLRVEGYFEENKLPRIRVNDRATIRLIGQTSDLTGHVESIAGGIEDRER